MVSKSLKKKKNNAFFCCSSKQMVGFNYSLKNVRNLYGIRREHLLALCHSQMHTSPGPCLPKMKPVSSERLASPLLSLHSVNKQQAGTTTSQVLGWLDSYRLPIRLGNMFLIYTTVLRNKISHPVMLGFLINPTKLWLFSFSNATK